MGSFDARAVVLGLRIAHAILAIIVLALTAYGTRAITDTPPDRLTPRSRQLVGQLLAQELAQRDQLPPLRRRLDLPRSRISHHRAMALLQHHGASQVCYPRR